MAETVDAFRLFSLKQDGIYFWFENETNLLTLILTHAIKRAADLLQADINADARCQGKENSFSS